LNFPWINRCEPTIVVGIENVDRRRDFTFPTSIAADQQQWPTTGHSEAFILFLQNELQPLIEKHYRTTWRKILIGQSLGGLLGYEIALTHPHLFTDMLLISPSLWWDDASLIERYRANARRELPSMADIYVAYGDEGRVMRRTNRRLYRILTKAIASPGRIHLQHIKGHAHGDIGHVAVATLLQKMHSEHRKRRKF
jgi:predicted alpha/beta superfamily hydrolase